MIECCNEYEDEKQSCWAKGSEHKSFPKCQITLCSNSLRARNFWEIWLKKVQGESKHDSNWQFHLSRSTVVLLFIYNSFIPSGTGGIHWQCCYFDHRVTLPTTLKCKLLWKPKRCIYFILVDQNVYNISHQTPIQLSGFLIEMMSETINVICISLTEPQ